MTDTNELDLHATEVLWDLEPLLDGQPADVLLDRAHALATGLAAHRGTIASLDGGALAAILHTVAEIHDLLQRAGGHANLSYVTDTANPDNARRLQSADERINAIGKELLFIELEWAAVDDVHAESVLAHADLQFCNHWLRSSRRYRPYLLSEPEERLISDKDLTGSRAWGRLFDELCSEIKVQTPTEEGSTKLPLEVALSQLMHPDRDHRDRIADGVAEALAPGLRTRAFIYNTLLADKAAEDDLRGYDTWLSSRNLANEASDASVQALLDAVSGRYDVAQRWYRIKARLLGLDTLGEHDRYAPLATEQARVSWSSAKQIVLEAYASFSPQLAETAQRFFDERWIHAPVQPGKVGGAFCAYTSAQHHPYVLLNWTGTPSDVLTLAHELGHGLHAMLAREQGVFQQSTPLTLAETASVFGETVTFGTLMDAVDSDTDRLALLARSIEGNMATVFRQSAMCRFEDRVHTLRRTEGELSIEQFDTAWLQTQRALYGDSVIIGDRYRSWWSYIPHFYRVPGYVYAYAYGQLLALSVHQRYTQRGDSFVPDYLKMLAAGGSMSPGDLTALVDCNLEDPGFWDAGIDQIEAQVDEAEKLSRSVGKLSGT